MRVGLYGGSFNPVHLGHVGIARRAVADLALDRLVVIPAFVSPFKTGASPSDGVLFPPEERLRLVRLAFADVPRASVDDRELRRGGVSYAIDTVRELRAEFERALAPGDSLKLFFIIGEDSVAGLPRWREYGELVKLCEFVAYPRTRESSTEIRRRLARGEPMDDLVPTAVLSALRRGCESPKG
ncbi:MAG: nicotinate (nicotinamide) nucleotide adenylyltransferase [Lentisphaerae bacterium]|jgi:nicotinate-nucleotide adenylyltransferase|nr:nicotinate (nicotinamide) nucleotide adenylyltransferase [Lentisphaerota bacterium]